MATKNQRAEYYCVAVKRNYEETWRLVSKHSTLEEAQAELDKLRSFTGAFNYDNAQLRIISRSEGKKEFGKSWEYVPIGGVRKKMPRPELEE
jgi:hypothetical protein